MHRPIYAGQSSKTASTTAIASSSRPQISSEEVYKVTRSENEVVGTSQDAEEQSTWETATTLATQAAVRTVESMKVIATAASHAVARGAISEDEEEKLGTVGIAGHTSGKTEFVPRPIIKAPPQAHAPPAAKVVHTNHSTVKVPQPTVVHERNLHPNTPTTAPPAWPRQQPVQVTRVPTGNVRVVKGDEKFVPTTPHQRQGGGARRGTEEEGMIGSPMKQNRGSKAPEDWISVLIEVLWPKIRKVTEDIAWEQVPRKF